MENRYARYAEQPLQEERPFDFHTSNIQRAQTERLAQRIVRLENPILRPPEGRSLRDVSSVNGTQKQNAFSARKRYFTFPAPFSSISFPARGKRYGPRSGGCGSANRTAPPAHSKHAAGGIPRHSGAHEITPLPVRKMAHRRPCRIQTPSK